MEFKLALVVLAVVSRVTVLQPLGDRGWHETNELVDVEQATMSQDLEDIARDLTVLLKERAILNRDRKEDNVELVSWREEDQKLGGREPMADRGKSVNVAARRKSSQRKEIGELMKSLREMERRSKSEKDLRRHRLYLFQKPLQELADIESIDRTDQDLFRSTGVNEKIKDFLAQSHAAVIEDRNGNELFSQGLASTLNEAVNQGQEADEAIVQVLLQSMAVDRQKRETDEDRVVLEVLDDLHRTLLRGYSPLHRDERNKDTKSNVVVNDGSLENIRDFDNGLLPKLPTTERLPAARTIQGQDSTHSTV